MTVFATIVAMAKLQGDDNSKRYSCPKEQPRILVDGNLPAATTINGMLSLCETKVLRRVSDVALFLNF
jgi:hypothetical protein